jgi:hypothetical protein
MEDYEIPCDGEFLDSTKRKWEGEDHHDEDFWFL